MNDPKPGDIMVATSPHSLARKIKITEVTPKYFKATVLEGLNREQPLTVYRVGWPLYRKQP